MRSYASSLLYIWVWDVEKVLRTFTPSCFITAAWCVFGLSQFLLIQPPISSDAAVRLLTRSESRHILQRVLPPCYMRTEVKTLFLVYTALNVSFLHQWTSVAVRHLRSSEQRFLFVHRSMTKSLSHLSKLPKTVRFSDCFSSFFVFYWRF